MTTPVDISVLDLEDMRFSPTAWLFEGGLRAGVGVSMFIVRTPPGSLVELHTHPYPETMAVAVVDTVGAGDSFGAALVAALVDARAFGPGCDRVLDADVLGEAVTYAVAASAVTCTRRGAVPPTRAEVAEQLRSVAA